MDKKTKLQKKKVAKKKVNVAKKLSEIVSDGSKPTEENLNHGTLQSVDLQTVVVVGDANDEVVERKCECSCHETEILSTNDCILREICDPEQYDDAFGSPPHSPVHSIHGCDETSQGKQCCVIQEAVWRHAQIKKSFIDGYLMNVKTIGNDESPPSSKTYELPKHAIV
eukprot:UN01593